MNKHHIFPMNLGVSAEGIKALTQGSTKQKIDHDFQLLESQYRCFPEDLENFTKQFHTYLWTLLGEIGVPNSLGSHTPTTWPVLLFPCGQPHRGKIEEWILKAGAKISAQQNKPITPLLHACLYAGQAWYPSLSKAFAASCAELHEDGVLMWITSGEGQNVNLAAVARRLQLHLRPTLPEWKTSIPGQVYPGVQRTFHTPRLENVLIHSLILTKDI